MFILTKIVSFLENRSDEIDIKSFDEELYFKLNQFEKVEQKINEIETF